MSEFVLPPEATRPVMRTGLEAARDSGRVSASFVEAIFTQFDAADAAEAKAERAVAAGEALVEALEGAHTVLRQYHSAIRPHEDCPGCAVLIESSAALAAYELAKEEA